MGFSSSSPKLYDAFINLRGPDIEETMAFSLYDTLEEKGFRTFLDVEELQLGDSLQSAIKNAICSSSVQIAIFSPRYAESPWCLSELVDMLKINAPFIPVFCDVKPFDVRYPHKGVYKYAFAKLEEKGRFSKERLDEWKSALHLASLVPGYEFSTSNNDVERLCSMIALAVQHELGRPGLVSRFADVTSTFNWGALAFVLGSYGLLLSNPLFWMCWSILVTKAVIYYSIQPDWERIEGTRRPPRLSIQPYCERIEGIRSRHRLSKQPYRERIEGTRRHHRLSDHGRAGAIIFKLGICIALISVLLYSQDITQRQNTILLILAASVFLFEGITPLLTGREGSSLRRNSSDSITQGLKWKALISLIPSALNAMITMTGPIVLGGDLGQLMRKEAFWGFTFLFLVDVFAEFFPGIVSEKSSTFFMPEDLPKTYYVAVILLRVIVEGCLCCWMGKMIYGHSYFPSQMGVDECNKLCRERSEQLLITMVTLGGLQAAATLSCVVAHRNDPTLPLFSRPNY